MAHVAAVRRLTRNFGAAFAAEPIVWEGEGHYTIGWGADIKDRVDYMHFDEAYRAGEIGATPNWPFQPGFVVAVLTQSFLACMRIAGIEPPPWLDPNSLNTGERLAYLRMEETYAWRTQSIERGIAFLRKKVRDGTLGSDSLASIMDFCLQLHFVATNIHSDECRTLWVLQAIISDLHQPDPDFRRRLHEQACAMLRINNEELVGLMIREMP